MSHFAKLKGNKGFSLLEVILAIVILSIFSVIAVTRQPSTDVTLKSQKIALESHLHYAQTKSMNTDTEWGLFIESATSYSLYKQTTDNKRILPGEDNNAVDLSTKNISIPLAASNSATISFDEWGRPKRDGTLIESNLTVSLVKQGAQETITIIPNTGLLN